MADPRFGRLYKRDKRDDRFRLSTLLGGRTTKKTQQFWKDDYWVGDQGLHPRCVGFAWAHWLESGPVLHPDSQSPAADPVMIYNEAQKVDEWPGENYAGTSVRAGAKVLTRLGFIESYLWAKTISEIVYALCEVGPVVVGTNWHAGMDKPKKNGRIRPKGPVLGGHAYLLSGVDREKKYFRIRNSWGLQWGSQGRAIIKFKDFKKLLQARGEACLAVEISN